MVAVPAVPPVTTPVAVITLAVPEALLAQVPPPGASLNEVVKPEQTVSVPNMVPGNVVTVTTIVAAQLPMV